MAGIYTHIYIVNSVYIYIYMWIEGAGEREREILCVNLGKSLRAREFWDFQWFDPWSWKCICFSNFCPDTKAPEGCKVKVLVKLMDRLSSAVFFPMI